MLPSTRARKSQAPDTVGVYVVCSDTVLLLHWSLDLERGSAQPVPFLLPSFSPFVAPRKRSSTKSIMDSSNNVDQVGDVEMSLPSHTVTSSLEVTGVTSVSPVNPGTHGSLTVPGAVQDGTPTRADQVPTVAEGHNSELIEHWATHTNGRVATAEAKIAHLESGLAQAQRALADLRLEVQPDALAHKLRDFVLAHLQDRVLPVEMRVATLEQRGAVSTHPPSSMQISQAPAAGEASKATRAVPAPDDRERESADDVPSRAPSRASKASKRKTKSTRSKKTTRDRGDPSSSDPSSSSSSTSSSSSDSDTSDDDSESSRRRSSRHRRGRNDRRNRRRQKNKASSTRNAQKETRSLGRDEDEDLVLGPSHEGVITLTSTNPRYRRLMNYRYYRLNRTKQERSSYEVGKVNSRASKIETGIGDKFSGSDPVRIFSALRDIVQEANNNKVTEGQLFLAVPRLLTGHAKKHFESSRDGSRRGAESIASWPETVNFLLTAYATPRAITSALDDLREVKQEKGETEPSYSDRVNAAMSRCGGVHTSEEKSTHFVEHLLPSVSPIIAQRREEKPDMMYYALVRYATMIGDAERARSDTRRSLKGSSSDKRKQKGTRSSSKNLVLDERKKKKRSSRSSTSTLPDSVGSSATNLQVLTSGGVLGARRLVVLRFGVLRIRQCRRRRSLADGIALCPCTEGFIRHAAQPASWLAGPWTTSW